MVLIQESLDISRLVNHRIGGLELLVKSALHISRVNHRIGGLEFCRRFL